MDDEILIIFGTNIPDTTGYQMIIYVPASPHYLGKNKQNITFCLISIIV